MTERTSACPFLADGGEMGALMRAYPWTGTALGEPSTWPQSLRSMISVCLNSPMLGAVLWGPELRMLYNDAYIPLMRDRHPAALGQPVADIWGEEWLRVAKPLLEVMSGGKGFERRSVAVPMVRDGLEQLTHWDFTTAPIRGEDGAIIGLFNQGVDITERVLGAEAARESEAQLRQALAAGDGVGTWAWDVVEDRVRADARFAHLYGVPVELARSGGPIANFFRRIHPDDLPRVRAAVAEALRTGDVFSEEYRLVDERGTVRWVLARGQCERAADGTPLRFPGASFDITERKRLEDALNALNADLEQRVEARTQELSKAEDALRQSQKMEAVGQLTGGLAHDFNNLIQGITGSLQIARRRIEAGRLEDVDRFMDGALRSADRASALTHRLLAFARRQPLDPRPVDANGLIASLADIFRRTVGEGIDLAIAPAADLWKARCDPHLLESALLNLVINARDAMPDGGSLRIESANARLEGSAATTNAGVLSGDYVCISVADTGCGMSEETKSRAFEPFFTTKQMGHGTGLGLSMIYGFAGQSEGNVTIASELGRGTTISLYLPRDDGVSQPEIASPPVEAPSAAGRGETILVIEDEEIVRDLIVLMLRDLGYEVVEAADGVTGIAILKSSRPIDLLVTDIGLPGQDGWVVADVARAERPDLKILFMTGYAEKAELAESVLGSGMAMVTKPISIEALADRIREMIPIS
ncbi:response regulator [Sphingomonas sp. BIUV-7]|uniref:histidine kinase n=1 Tax=Sphingomonas natans TaxID=3063330 RepID=A0ABT8Y9C1_9SPHN|nr:ATP-binding protein [Sphingomonas sp. BIUV-7]MDO6414924.1 response regulator [Sphingomonas sp. BIUV-7]